MRPGAKKVPNADSLAREPGSRSESVSATLRKFLGINNSSLSASSFSPHTYLVRSWAINKAFAHDLSPALHIAEAKVIELPSGTSFAQFLMVFLTLEVLFIDVSCVVLSFEEEIFMCLDECR